ncbi:MULTISPECIES: amidase [unclassified Imperialibacter]|uniref:amidase n=1 Tax=unclassified Imperialibacter TaxID=2629706 RepID=UPI001256E892|nr:MULTISPECIES: amidase [unclassified Imperialibacter]CAD5273395.1 Amidase [Imperialibacter sp. 89]CAD5289080.1 Amidase [Imperialibacter sp. 75]VVT14205.1 Amidase [Imperialibacter sp. EC-SDR9]
MKAVFGKAALFVLVAVVFFSLGQYVSLTNEETISYGDIISAGELIGVPLTRAEADSMLEGVASQRESYLYMRRSPLANDVVPAMQFNPLPLGFGHQSHFKELKFGDYTGALRPAADEELAFMSIGELAELIRTKQISSLELTQFYIDRIKKFDPQLHAIVTLMEDYALEKAANADKEISQGNYKGLLHGIPFGAKDLLAKKGFKTTWGAMPYKDQEFEVDATVVERLENAGAILVAKTTLGALAMGDIWFGGKTRNPWNTEKGSSGSSAGSASTVSAGLLPFAIGSETLGSIVSPSTVCGVTGLRPTYGRVSRHGAMALSWSMDKLGPLCRNVEDCAIVLAAIGGPDGKDDMVLDFPFYYEPAVDLKALRIGYVKSDFDKEYAFRRQDSVALQVLKELGAELIPIELPNQPVGDMTIILSAEAAAAFEELTLSGRDDQLVNQQKWGWPNSFRESRLIPAVEYIQANRLRTQLIQDMTRVFQKVDVYLAPSREGKNLRVTNLSGHPSVVLPNGFSDDGTPTSLTFTGRLFDEGTLLAVAKAYQNATDWHKKHPKLD